MSDSTIRELTMTSVTIYHNPRCSKSRETLSLLEQKGLDINIHLYLEKPLSTGQLKTIISTLGVAAKEIIRTGEDAYESSGLNESSSDEQIVDAITQAPILMQRPIVLSGGGARIGRPPSSVLEIL